MADKPSRALVIYGDGQASLVAPSHTHLHSFASLASCGFLSLRESIASETKNDRVFRDLAQLLDVYDFYVSWNKEHDKSDAYIDKKELSFPTISERFMGLKAACFTNCPSVGSFAEKIGFSVLQFEDLIKRTDSSEPLQEVPDDMTIASELLGLLGFVGGDVVDKYEFDLVFLHIGTEISEDQKEKMLIGTDVDWINNLVGNLMHTAQPGSNIASRLHLSIVLSYDTVSEGKEDCFLTLNSSSEANSDLYLLRPCQSYTMKEGRPLNDIRHHHPMLVAQWQEGVTRKDLTKAFTFQEFKENGGNLAILADRFLHEVAFKLWKAPKYGA